MPLTINKLTVATPNNTDILHDISLSINPGEIHCLMGPNGSGKSTLALTLLGHPEYQVTQGKISLDNTKITNMSVTERARLGLFLCMQHPISIPGVTVIQLLQTALDQLGKHLSPIEAKMKIDEEARKLQIPPELLYRSLNEGFSGGEKKKMELLQIGVIEPSYIILDEPDSGVDVDASTIIATYIKQLVFHPGILLITHYSTMLKILTPDVVHVMSRGQIRETGDATLAADVLKNGYQSYV